MTTIHSTTQPKVAVIGAGLMGHGIALVFGLAGYDVSIWDPDSKALASVPHRLSEHSKALGKNGPPTVIHAESLEHAVAGRQLVIEAAPERMDLKQDLVAQIEVCNENCIIASNTSVLRITEIAEGSRRPENIVGTHWWNPPYLIPLVEIVRGNVTSDETVAKVTGWVKDAGKVPVEVFKDAPGFVGNRMQFALMREAAHIVEEGICTPETVDLVARLTFGSRLRAIGPLRNADFIGLDLTCAIMDYLCPSLATTPSAPDLFKRMLRGGHQGAKSGKGIYAWAKGERDQLEADLISHLQRLDKA